MALRSAAVACSYTTSSPGDTCPKPVGARKLATSGTRRPLLVDFVSGPIVSGLFAARSPVIAAVVPLLLWI